MSVSARKCAQSESRGELPSAGTSPVIRQNELCSSCGFPVLYNLIKRLTAHYILFLNGFLMPS